MLIQQLSSTRHLATERFYRTLYESLLDPRLATSSKQALYLNLLYRALKSDVDVRRVKAFVKRMLQVLNLHQPSFVCGILFLTTELCVTFPDLKTLLTDPEEHDETITVEAEDTIQIANGTEARSKDAYDGRKRDPEYSNAHRSCLWELIPFLRHFHPSVDLYAASLLNGQKPAQKPDLANHTLIHFLDKFVYRNPKTTDSTKGQSLMQPVVASGSSSVLLSNNKSMAKTASLNSAAFWNKKADEVAVDDVFFHEYFSQVGKPVQEERQKKKAKKDEDEEVDSEEDEDEIWEALKSSRPEVDGGESESDLGSDFDELMDDGSDLDLDGEDGNDEDVEIEGGSDDEMPFSDVSSLGFSDEDEEGAEAEEGTEDKPVSENNKRRKMLKSLPTFASAEDYADMLADEEDGM
jgi:ribosome biogenesis protein MAK21